VDIKKTVAPRFTLKLPMKYRPVGDVQWRETYTTNVSSSGAVFVASEVLPVASKVEIEIWMKARLLTPSAVLTISEVVRQGSDGGHLVTVVKHLQYEVRADSESKFTSPAGTHGKLRV
jgi:hypothetical protein